MTGLILRVGPRCRSYTEESNVSLHFYLHCQMLMFPTQWQDFAPIVEGCQGRVVCAVVLAGVQVVMFGANEMVDDLVHSRPMTPLRQA